LAQQAGQAASLSPKNHWPPAARQKEKREKPPQLQAKTSRSQSNQSRVLAMDQPGSTIGILGGGQLGRMLAMAAAKLGFRAAIYAPKDDSPAFQAGLFSGQDFICDAKNDHYTCPAGEILTKAAVGTHRKHDFDRYRNLIACLSCELKPQCAPDSPSTRDNIKHIKRRVHEGLLDKMQALRGSNTGRNRRSR
jgi:ribonucleotide synthetase-like protein